MANEQAKKQSKYDASKILSLLNGSLRYKETQDLPSKWDENIQFVIGNQWKSVAENSKTKNFPRPVMNFCEFIVSHKTSVIQNENVKMVFKSDGDNELGSTFSRFSEKEWERLKFDELASLILDDSAIKGVGISYFYIEPSEDGRVKLQRERIDPVNFHVSNVKQNDVQKQEWIVVVQRLPIEDIQDIADNNGINFLVTNDSETIGSKYSQRAVDIDGVEKANLINFFYKDRADGNIHMIRLCQDTIIEEDFNLNIKKFPFSIMQWTNKTEDFWSKSEIDFMKTNQRQVNTLIALQLMNIQLSGFPKMWSKKSSLNPKSVKGSIGEILIDNSNQQGLQFGWLQPAPLNEMPMNLMEQMVNYTKQLAGAQDSEIGAGNAQNASAILALQKRSGIALDKLKRRYYQFIEDCGSIWLEFFCYYYIMDRQFTYTDEWGQQQEAIFNAKDVNPDNLNIKCDVGISSQYTEEFTIQSLDKFLQMGLIDFPTYLRYVPDNVVPFKESLLQQIQQQEQAQMEAEQQAQMQGLQPQGQNVPVEGQQALEGQQTPSNGQDPMLTEEDIAMAQQGQPIEQEQGQLTEEDIAMAQNNPQEKVMNAKDTIIAQMNPVEKQLFSTLSPASQQKILYQRAAKLEEEENTPEALAKASGTTPEQIAILAELLKRAKVDLSPKDLANIQKHPDILQKIIDMV